MNLLKLFEYLNGRKEVDQKAFLKHFKLTIKTHRWNFIDDDKKAYPCCETKSQILTRVDKANISVDKLEEIGITIFETELKNLKNKQDNEQNEIKKKTLNYLISDIEQKLETAKNNKYFALLKTEETLWHILYSVHDKDDIKKALSTFAKRHSLHEESFVENFKKYPLIKSEYGSFSEKAIKKMLPLMRMGKYWNEYEILINMDSYQKNISEVLNNINKRKNTESKVKEKLLNIDSDINAFKGLTKDIVSYIVYKRHSESGENKTWKTVADLEKYFKDFKQHSLRNPIVEQVVTESLRVVKDIWQKYGEGKENFFDEIHIELGREMKNNAEDRKAITESNLKNESTNLRIRTMLAEFVKPEFEIEGVRPYSPYQQDALKIFEDGIINSGIEIPEDIEKISKSSQPTDKEILKYKLWLEQRYRSPYTGEMIPLNKLFTSDYEIEHIIPQSIYFDDSFSNKVICESIVNKRPYKDNKLGYEFINEFGGYTVPELSTKYHTVKIFTKNEYEEFIKTNYAKNKGKAKKLLLEEIPDKMIERQLNDTRYISKMIKNLLSNLVREDKDDEGITSKNIISTNGTITGILKQDWGLNDIWNDLVLTSF